MNARSTLFCSLAAAVAATGIGLWTTSAPAKDQPAPDKAAVERTRKTVQMLDDVYKTAVVLITDKYVNDEADFPAGSAAIALFEAIGKKGWHQARLIDLTGKPYEPKNVPGDEVEKAGAKALNAGQATYEQIVYQDGKPHLRVLTSVPVVMKKCVLCHPHYADVKEGKAIGAISYTVPIE